MERRARELDDGRPVEPRGLGDRGGEAGLPDPGLTAQHDRGGSVGGARAHVLPHLVQLVELLGPSHDGRARAQWPGVGPGPLAAHAVRAQRLGHTLHRLARLRLEDQHRLGQRAHLLGDDDGPGCGERLEPGRDVDREPVDVVLLGVEIEDAVVDRDTDVEQLADVALGRLGELVDRIDDVEPGPYGALDVVAVRAGDPEEREQPVTGRVRDVPVVAVLDDLAAPLLVATDEPAVQLGLVAAGELGGPDEVAEHDRGAAQLARARELAREQLLRVRVRRVLGEHLTGEPVDRDQVAAVGRVEHAIEELGDRALGLARRGHGGCYGTWTTTSTVSWTAPLTTTSTLAQ